MEDYSQALTEDAVSKGNVEDVSSESKANMENIAVPDNDMNNDRGSADGNLKCKESGNNEPDIGEKNKSDKLENSEEFTEEFFDEMMKDDFLDNMDVVDAWIPENSSDSDTEKNKKRRREDRKDGHSNNKKNRDKDDDRKRNLKRDSRDRNKRERKSRKSRDRSADKNLSNRDRHNRNSKDRKSRNSRDKSTDRNLTHKDRHNRNSKDKSADRNLSNKDRRNRNSRDRKNRNSRDKSTDKNLSNRDRKKRSSRDRSTDKNLSNRDKHNRSSRDKSADRNVSSRDRRNRSSRDRSADKNLSNRDRKHRNSRDRKNSRDRSTDRQTHRHNSNKDTHRHRSREKSTDRKERNKDSEKVDKVENSIGKSRERRNDESHRRDKEKVSQERRKSDDENRGKKGKNMEAIDGVIDRKSSTQILEEKLDTCIKDLDDLLPPGTEDEFIFPLKDESMKLTDDLNRKNSALSEEHSDKVSNDKRKSDALGSNDDKLQGTDFREMRRVPTYDRNYDGSKWEERKDRSNYSDDADRKMKRTDYQDDRRIRSDSKEMRRELSRDRQSSPSSSKRRRSLSIEKHNENIFDSERNIELYRRYKQFRDSYDAGKDKFWRSTSGDKEGNKKKDREFDLSPVSDVDRLSTPTLSSDFSPDAVERGRWQSYGRKKKYRRIPSYSPCSCRSEYSRPHSPFHHCSHQRPRSRSRSRSQQRSRLRSHSRSRLRSRSHSRSRLRSRSHSRSRLRSRSRSRSLDSYTTLSSDSPYERRKRKRLPFLKELEQTLAETHNKKTKSQLTNFSFAAIYQNSSQGFSAPANYPASTGYSQPPVTYPTGNAPPQAPFDHNYPPAVAPDFSQPFIPPDMSQTPQIHPPPSYLPGPPNFSEASAMPPGPVQPNYSQASAVQMQVPQPVEMPMQLPGPPPMQLPGPQPMHLPGPQPMQLPGPQPMQLPGPQPMQLLGPQPMQLPGPQPMQLPGPQPMQQFPGPPHMQPSGPQPPIHQGMPLPVQSPSQMPVQPHMQQLTFPAHLQLPGQPPVHLPVPPPSQLPVPPPLQLPGPPVSSPSHLVPSTLHQQMPQPQPSVSQPLYDPSKSFLQSNSPTMQPDKSSENALKRKLTKNEKRRDAEAPPPPKLSQFYKDKLSLSSILEATVKVPVDFTAKVPMDKPKKQMPLNQALITCCEETLYTLQAVRDPSFITPGPIVVQDSLRPSKKLEDIPESLIKYRSPLLRKPDIQLNFTNHLLFEDFYTVSSEATSATDVSKSSHDFRVKHSSITDSKQADSSSKESKLPELGVKESKEISAKDSKEYSAKDSKECSAKDSKECSAKDSKENSAKDSKGYSAKDSKGCNAKDSKEYSAKDSKRYSAKDSKEHSSKDSKKSEAKEPKSCSACLERANKIMIWNSTQTSKVSVKSVGIQVSLPVIDKERSFDKNSKWERNDLGMESDREGSAADPSKDSYVSEEYRHLREEEDSFYRSLTPPTQKSSSFSSSRYPPSSGLYSQSSNSPSLAPAPRKGILKSSSSSSQEQTLSPFQQQRPSSLSADFKAFLLSQGLRDSRQVRSALSGSSSSALDRDMRVPREATMKKLMDLRDTDMRGNKPLLPSARSLLGHSSISYPLMSYRSTMPFTGGEYGSSYDVRNSLTSGSRFDSGLSRSHSPAGFPGRSTPTELVPQTTFDYQHSDRPTKVLPDPASRL